MRVIHLTAILLISCSLTAQNFTPTQINPQIDTMSDEQKVDFIIDNLYGIVLSQP